MHMTLGDLIAGRDSYKSDYFHFLRVHLDLQTEIESGKYKKDADKLERAKASSEQIRVRAEANFERAEKFDKLIMATIDDTLRAWGEDNANS